MPLSEVQVKRPVQFQNAVPAQNPRQASQHLPRFLPCCFYSYKLPLVQIGSDVIHILLQSPINPNKVQVWATPVKFFYPLTLSYPSCQIVIKTWETCQHHIFYLTFLIFHYRLLPHTGLVLPFGGWTRGSMLYASLPELWWANSNELSPLGNLLWKLSLCVSLCVLPMLWYMKGQAL